MNQTDLFKIGGVAAVVVIIGTLAIFVKQQPNDQTTEASNSANEPSTTDTTNQTASTQNQPPATGPLEQDTIDEPFNPYPTGNETGEELAIVFGCGWWARPIPGETITELGERMKPVISQQMYDDIVELRNPGQDSVNTIEAIPGAVTPTEPVTNPDGSQTQQYNVACNTIEIDTENKPIDQTAQETEVTLTQTPDGTTYVSKALVGGLTIPLN